jgi:hypothetical protein
MRPVQYIARRLAALLSLAVLDAAGLATAGDARWQALEVAGGTEAVAARAGLPEGLPAWRVMYEAARNRHGAEGEGALSRKGEPGAAPAMPGSAVALPLSPGTWWQLLDRRGRGDGQLAFAILADRRAALMYQGLAGLDDETLASLAPEPDVLRALFRHHADVLAAFGGRFRVRHGAVVAPGGEEAGRLWEALVGESLHRPAAFLLRLVAQGDGGYAFLFDAIAALDLAHQRFALGLSLPEGERLPRLRELASVFDREPAWWRSAGSMLRPEVDAARVLRECRLGPDGRLAAPAERELWDAVFSGAEEAASGSGGPPPDAAWLAGQVGRGDPRTRQVRFEQLTFAQRVLGPVGADERDDALVALSGLRDARMLLLVLERMGIRDPAVLARAVRTARRVDRRGGEASRAVLGAFEGALAVLDRARFSRTLDAAEAERLVDGLLRTVGRSGAEDRVAAWIDETLVPALGRAAYGEHAPQGGAEATVVRAMAGDRESSRSGLPRVEWEGLPFRVDPGRAERLRLERVRARQGGLGLDRALEVCRAERAERPKASSCPRVLSTVLVSLAYAAHLGDPNGPALAGEDPSTRHDFGPEPWGLPVEVVGPGIPWHVRGSLLGLEAALAPLGLRSLSGDALPDRPPALGIADRRTLALGVALMNPRELSDGDRDAIAAAIERGRLRALRLTPGDREIEAIARDAGLAPWREQALAWLLEHDVSSLAAFFSLGELLRLGAPEAGRWDAWGVPRLEAAGLELSMPRGCVTDDARGGSLDEARAAAFPDPALRAAVHLRSRHLPAALAPGVVAALLPELFLEARPLWGGDRLALDAWVRDVPTERLDDAIASLAGTGPLQPDADGRTP